MAHFARMMADNIVLKVHVLDNKVLLKDGSENEQQGIEFLQNLYKTDDVFIQTSYNGNFRKNYTTRGDTYDPIRDAFIRPKPYPSWVLDEDTCQWEAPTVMPDDDKQYKWDEDTTDWVESDR